MGQFLGEIVIKLGQLGGKKLLSDGGRDTCFAHSLMCGRWRWQLIQ